MTVEETRTQGLSRRNILVGSAWAAPAVVVGASAPAFAASAPGPQVYNLQVLIERNGNSANFIVKVDAAASGIAAGQLVTVTGSFDIAAATATVTDNSSGWVVRSNTKTATSFTFIADRVHDGATTLAVAKFKLTADSNVAALSDKTVTFVFSVGGRTVGIATGAFPTIS